MRGVAVTGATPFTLLPRHGLACADQPPLTTVCRATVSGELFTITTVRKAPDSSIPTNCTAAYGVRTAPCRDGFPPYTVADGGTLGLDGAAILAARPAWLPDRWLGDMWLSAFVGLAVLLALGVGVASLNVPPPHPSGD